MTLTDTIVTGHA